jgi:hypothetical protein
LAAPSHERNVIAQPFVETQLLPGEGRGPVIASEARRLSALPREISPLGVWAPAFAGERARFVDANYLARLGRGHA